MPEKKHRFIGVGCEKVAFQPTQLLVCSLVRYSKQIRGGEDKAMARHRTQMDQTPGEQAVELGLRFM